MLLGLLGKRRSPDFTNATKWAIFASVWTRDIECCTPWVLRFVSTEQRLPCSFTMEVCNVHSLPQNKTGKKIHHYLDCHLLKAGKVFSLFGCANKMVSWFQCLWETPKYTRLFSGAFWNTVFRLCRNPSNWKGSQLCLRFKLCWCWRVLVYGGLCSRQSSGCSAQWAEALEDLQTDVAIYPEQEGQDWHSGDLYRKGESS